MVVKKKTPKVEALVLDDEKLHLLLASLSVDGGHDGVRQVAKTLHTCLELKDPVQQIQLVKKAGLLLGALGEETIDGDVLEACLQTLVLGYISLQAKNPLRRAISSALCTVPTWLQERTTACLSKCLSDSLSNPTPDQYSHVVNTIAGCMDGFPLGERCINELLPEVLQFLHKGLREYFTQNSGVAGRHIAQAQLMHSCLAAVKTSMLVIQRCQESVSSATTIHQTLKDTLSSLLDCYISIITDEDFVQAVQSTSGMAVVLLIRSVMGCGDDVASVVCGLLRSSVDGLDSAPVWIKQRCERLCTSARQPGVSMYLCHGALAMLSWKGSPAGPHWEKLLLLVPNILLDLDVSVKESSSVLLVVRVLMLWSSAALDCLQGKAQHLCALSLQQSLNGGSDLHRRLLEHIYSHWEHPLDGARHQTCSLFHNLILIHQHINSSETNPDSYVLELTQRLFQLDWHMRGKYGALSCLVDLYGAGYLLELQPELPSCLLGLMSDQPLAPYASDLLEKLFISHKEQLAAEASVGKMSTTTDWMEHWHRMWVTPLLQVLCSARVDDTTYILDYFLPKLLRCSPSSLSHMVRALQDKLPCCKDSTCSRGALGALMTCLRAARSQGVMQSTAEGLCEELVPFSLLRQALIHKHDQVRMDALGLVCESHRSTEVLTSQEMDLIRHFLLPNLNSQSPNVRQQVVSLFKKMLCRVKDSRQLLLKRQSQEREQEQRAKDQHIICLYKEFLHELCSKLFDVLIPGASFSKCIMSLNLLGLLAELFTFGAGPDGFALGEVVTPTYAQNVLYCVASNFMEVKLLATTLLWKLPLSALGLEEPDVMHGLLQAALDLSTSTKPFDSVTAAHLLSLLLHQPNLSQALLCCAQEQGLDFQPPSPSLPPEPNVQELNTLSVIQFLLCCLQSEVSKAECCLLQAAASYPLYGRAHCITAVLRNIDTECLCHTEEWRRLVSELIATCYRLSDVVSPIVQSSSPEGLIPMDVGTVTDTSAGLQKILHEIQPRDTNDFFNCARELDTQDEVEDQEETQTTRTVPPDTGGEGYRVTAQMVLVCCWRSMKEVAMLLGQLCQSLPLHYSNGNTRPHPGLITEEQVACIGLYFRQQLLQSRHRGAFELAYVGFVRLTDMLCRSGSKVLQQLPACWLAEVLEEVKSSDPSSKLCATRRSAGIPFYIQALLSSEPKSSSCSLLKMTMRELITLAMPSANRNTDTSTVPQVHALNILRALYRDTRLGENIICFVSDGMQAAVLGFTSPIWAVRNSSTLLFSTLITRIFGVKKGRDEHSKKNRMTGREFFTRFPSLYPFLLNQLKEAAVSVESDSGQVKLHPSLFLLLLVLSRLYPSPMDGSSSPLGLAPFTPFIIRCGRSAVYRTREMAARALVPFVLVTQVSSTVHSLLQELPQGPEPHIQHNYIHGTLLQVLFLLQSYQSESHRPLPAGNGIGEAVLQRMWLASRANICVVTRGAFLDVLVCLCGPKIKLLCDSEVNKLRRETLSLLMTSSLVSNNSPPVSNLEPGSIQYMLSLTRVGLSASVEIPELWGKHPLTSQLLDHLLKCPQYEVRDLVLERVLMRLKEEEDQKRMPTWLNEATLLNLTSLVLHEKHPQCLAKVLQVLSVLCCSGELHWMDSVQQQHLSQDTFLQHLLVLAQTTSHSVELYCAAMALLSQLVIQIVKSYPKDAAIMTRLSQWGALVCSSCSDEQHVEIKLMVAKVLVDSTSALLSSSELPLGLVSTMSLWRSLFMLLQDEDQEVRSCASDFVANAPTHLICSDAAGVTTLCPPVALDVGVRLLCHLLQLWKQVPAGVLVLTEWLLGDDEGNEEAGADDASILDEEDFLFEKGNLNLWAEPVQWVILLHRHLISLLVTYKQMTDSRPTGSEQAQQMDTMASNARRKLLSSKQALDALPVLPQFSCPMEHARLVLQHQRATLALDVLDTLRGEIE